MKILLVAVNAKYIHSNLAVHSLRAYADKYAHLIHVLELTINHQEEDILQRIYREKAEVVAFSCYIWNIGMIMRVTAELRKVQPAAKIWLGGPEVAYDFVQCLKEHPWLDGIIVGEGEQTFLELAEYYTGARDSLSDIAGLAYAKTAGIPEDRNNADSKEVQIVSPGCGSYDKSSDSGRSTDSRCGTEVAVQASPEIIVTGDRAPVSLDRIPFPYKDTEVFRNRIVYYESSRGCPFSCSYCLSSVDRRVLFRRLELVIRELKFFLDNRVPQVKFVDRTFNCNKKHAMAIWQFIKENDNGITNFHFEIAADLLEEDETELLAALRPGQVQLEIGVQSTNPDTVEAIHRKMDFQRLAANVMRIKEGRNIHQHLDLIAGLPKEGYASFERSFADVYRLKPDQLQLGFLKILKGSSMESDKRSYGITARDAAPYEVLYTDDLSYEELLKLKGVCEMVEVYYNSGQFTGSMSFLEHYYSSPMQLYQSVSSYYEAAGLILMSHSRIRKYEILLDFFQKVVLESIDIKKRPDLRSVFAELLVFDLYLRENMKARPVFSGSGTKDIHIRRLYEKHQTGKRQIHIEVFQYDVQASAAKGTAVRKRTIILFDYDRRDPLNNSAEVTLLEG